VFMIFIIKFKLNDKNGAFIFHIIICDVFYCRSK